MSEKQNAEQSQEAREAGSELKGSFRPWMLEIAAEVERARAKFPEADLKLTAFSEEAGEVVKAALDHYHGKGSLVDVRKELIQAGAMVVRLLEEGDPIHRLPPSIHAA